MRVLHHTHVGLLVTLTVGTNVCIVCMYKEPSLHEIEGRLKDSDGLNMEEGEKGGEEEDGEKGGQQELQQEDSTRQEAS